MHHRFVSHSADWGRHSGNEHSSAYRRLPVVIFKWLPPSDASMMCVELSYVTMALAPEAETMIIKANGACLQASIQAMCTLFHEMREGMRMQSCACAGIHACTHTHTHTHVCARLSRQGANSVSSAPIARGTKDTKPRDVWMWGSALGQSYGHIGCLGRSA